MSRDKKHRGLRVFMAGLFIGCIGTALAFLDPDTGQGTSAGVLFKLGYGVAIVGVFIGVFGIVMHFVQRE